MSEEADDMPELTDPGALLRASNPVDSYPIGADRLDDLVWSIASPGHVAEPTSPHRVRRYAVASIAAAVLLVTGVVVALDSGGGRPRPVLGLRSVQVSSPGSPSARGVHGSWGSQTGHGSVGPPSAIVFSPGPNLSSASGQARVYVYTPATTSPSSLSVVASTLGVTDPVVQPDGNDGCGTTIRGDASSVWTGCTTPVSWVYNIKLPNCEGVTTTPQGRVVLCTVAEGFDDSGATQEQLGQWSATDAAALVPAGLTIGAPTYSAGLNWVSYPCEFQGTSILGCAETFQYSNAGELLFATGPIDPTGTFTSVGDYPLLSPVEGVSQVGAQAVTHGVQPSATYTVVLTSSTLEYAFATLANGDSALVPAYVYAGNDGGSYSTVAVDPSSLRASGGS